jgi:uncharacterized membrane protein HdeD (DUF308 family)
MYGAIQRIELDPRRRHPMKALGVILIVLGLLALAYQGFSYTKTEKVLDIGPVEVTAENKETVPLPPLLGGLALVGGIVLVVAGSKK